LKVFSFFYFLLSKPETHRSEGESYSPAGDQQLLLLRISPTGEMPAGEFKNS